MTHKRRLWSCLTRSHLIDIAKAKEISGSTRLKKEELVATLSRKRSVRIADVLKELSLTDLKSVCQNMGVYDGGRRKIDLVDRLLGRIRRKKSRHSVPVSEKPDKEGGKKRDAKASEI